MFSKIWNYFFEFHKQYFMTNEGIIGKQPKYFISSLVQFVGLSVSEHNYFNKKYPKH